jgi:D-alanyl-D-alanine dipeptidase
MYNDFVYLDEAIPGLRWDAKYATWDNFTGAPVSGYIVNRIIGTRKMSAALNGVKRQAEKLGYGLLLWDGYRPQRAVDHFLRWANSAENDTTKSRYYPNIDRKSMVSQGYIAAKSGHSRGSTIDLTLYCLGANAMLPMGGYFDLMDRISHHASRGISDEEMENRKLLKGLMEEFGFLPYEYEWWHYTLINEPFPDTYFDVVAGALQLCHSEYFRPVCSMPSRCRSAIFFSMPPAYPVRSPFLPITRWQGIKIETGLWPTALPIARAEVRFPLFSNSNCRARSP